MTMQAYADTLYALRQSGNFRSIPEPSTSHDIIDLSSNDYLGIAARTDLLQQFFDNESHRRLPMTSAASRLLAADQSEYSLLEQRLSELYGNRAALLFNSGYHANTGLISSLAAEPGTLIVADKLVHASIIDGITLSKAPFTRFVHNDFNRLESILKKESPNYRRIIVAVESVYSMDGDRTDLDILTDLKRRYPNILLYVDEAHAFGVLGDNGLGLCRSHPAFRDIDIIVGTFGKAAASMGAFCITDNHLRDYAINRARSFIFSTALPPVNCAWTRFVIDHMLGMDTRRQHLQSLSAALHQGIAGTSFRTAPQPSHIQPVIIGNPSEAVALSSRLLEHGFKVLPIRTPTVPPGTERLRISLSAALSLEHIHRFTNVLQALACN